MLIDTHCHLNFRAYRDDHKKIIADMKSRNMRAIVVGSQLSTSKRAIDFAQAHPETLYAAVALHPLHLHSMYVNEIEMPFTTREEHFQEETYRKLAGEPGVVAIGESGLDYFQMPEDMSESAFKNQQHEVFAKHIELAKSLDLPLIVHARANPRNYRDAYDDVFAILREHAYQKIVMHAFATHVETAKKFIEAGYMVSFTSLVTYPEFPTLPDLVRYVPLKQMMLETDAPYMTPHGKRGSKNLPQYVEIVAQAVAQMKGVPQGRVEEQTTANAISFFRL